MIPLLGSTYVWAWGWLLTVGCGNPGQLEEQNGGMAMVHTSGTFNVANRPPLREPTAGILGHTIRHCNSFHLFIAIYLALYNPKIPEKNMILLYSGQEGAVPGGASLPCSEMPCIPCYQFVGYRRHIRLIDACVLLNAGSLSLIRAEVSCPSCNTVLMFCVVFHSVKRAVAPKDPHRRPTFRSNTLTRYSGQHHHELAHTHARTHSPCLVRKGHSRRRYRPGHGAVQSTTVHTALL
ncbi:hypothetical protein VTK26DRAFT_7762 [Humicola hyalothermophila]